VPADAERIALPGKTLIPGLIDLHSHVLLHPYNETTWDDQVIKEQVGLPHRLAVRHAVDTLQAGFTTLRDLGTEGADYADVGIKRAIEEGKSPARACWSRPRPSSPPPATARPSAATVPTWSFPTAPSRRPASTR
jgi:imidazolonepropionase-like amidohydrolase